jgi:hypothetical protein
MTDPYTPTTPEFPRLEWHHGPGEYEMHATADLNDYVRDTLNGPHGRIDELLAAGIIPMLEKGGHLTQHDAELRQQVAQEFLEIMDRPTTWSEETRLPKLLRLFDALRAHAARIAEQGPTLDGEESSD